MEPENHIYLNDLGYSLLEAGLLQEAESVLKRSISLAPPEYQFARNNLELLYERQWLFLGDWGRGYLPELVFFNFGYLHHISNANQFEKSIAAQSHQLQMTPIVSLTLALLFSVNISFSFLTLSTRKEIKLSNRQEA